MQKTNPPTSVSCLWYKPRQAMQGLIEAGRGHGAGLAVAAGFGAVQALPVYLMPDTEGPLVLLLGALAGVGGLYLFAWLLRNFGRWFGGQASLRAVRTALGCSLLPWLVLFAVLFGALQGYERETVAQYYWIFFLGFLYGYVVVLLGLSAALQLSVVKTFLCLIVTALVSLFPLTFALQVLIGTPPSGAPPP
jgi:hypothetical protein